MPASYANRMKCKWARRQAFATGIVGALFISFAAISLAAADAVVPPAPATVTLHMPAQVSEDSAKTGNPLAPADVPAAEAAGNSAAAAAEPADGSPAATFAFEQFATADGVYVLDTRSGTVRTVSVQGGQEQTCSFPFAGLETAPAGTLITPGRFRGSLVQGALLVLDRQTGVLEKVLLSNLTRTVVLGAGARPPGAAAVTPGAGHAGAGDATGTPPEHGSATAGGATAAQGGVVTAEGHLPPPPTYSAVQVPAQVTAALREAAERDAADYSAFLGYPYIAAPLKAGYQLEVTIDNKGKRSLAALEVTIEYNDPKDGQLQQQRFYFRRDNGATNAPPGPGMQRTMTLQLPNLEDAPVFKIYTSFLLFAD